MDIMDHLSDIFPVIIFLFWVIFGVIFKSAMKNKVKPVSSHNSGDRNENAPPKRRPGTNLKEALRMVLEEMDLTERSDDELPESIPRKTDTILQPAPVSPEVIMSELPELTVQHRRSDDEKQPYKRHFLHPYQKQKENGVYVTGQKVDREEVRRGIIWSEILSPPLALRDPE